MKRLLLAAAAVAALTITAHADVILDPHLSGTGDNVVFDSFAGNTAIGSFNGQHSGLVTFTDLSNNPGFVGSANGNDIKIANTSDLFVQVFDTTGMNVLGTSTQVFSLKGTGDVTAFVQATDGLFTFDLGVIDPSAQSGFTLTAVNGESMSSLRLFDNTGSISDYEHYRIDVAAAVPGPIVGAGIPGLIASVLGMVGLNRFRRKHNGIVAA
jgi:hypothetical protein